MMNHIHAVARNVYTPTASRVLIQQTRELGRKILTNLQVKVITVTTERTYIEKQELFTIMYHAFLD